MLGEFSSLRMKTSTKDEPGMDMQQKQIQSTFRDIFAVPIIKGELIDLRFTAADTDVKFQHNLGRPPKGYIAVRLFPGSAILYVSPTTVQDPDREFILRATFVSAAPPFNARIWIF